MTDTPPRESLVAAVIPAFNEAATIEAVVRGVRAHVGTVICVDDGSHDGTGQIAAQAGARVIRHQKNRGKGAALTSGFEAARALGASLMVTLDGDGQHVPAEIPGLLAVAFTHPGAIVIGARTGPVARGGVARLIANRVADFWISCAARRWIRDSQSGMRVYPGALVDTVDVPDDPAHGFVFESEFLVEAVRQGALVMSVPVARVGRVARPSHFRAVRDVLRITRMVISRLFARRARHDANAAIMLSLALHALAIGWVLVAPAHWRAAVAIMVANQLWLAGCGLWPRSQVIGPNLTRLPLLARRRGSIALTIDDGPVPGVTPAVLDALDRHGMVATFFCVGERAQAHPMLLREIVARGHGIGNHSMHHPLRFALFGPRAMGREIDAAQTVFEDILGRKPRWFRAPAGLRNVWLSRVLAQRGLGLASWTRRGFDTLTGDPARVADRLLRGLAPGDILLLHDGHAARTRNGQPVILEVIPHLAQAARQAGLHFVSLADMAPRDPGVSPRA